MCIFRRHLQTVSLCVPSLFLFFGLVNLTILEAAERSSSKLSLFDPGGASNLEAPKNPSPEQKKPETSSKLGLFDAGEAPNVALESHKPKKPETSHRFYLGAFGGGGASNPFDVAQKGTAFYPASSGGPLAVDARGSSSRDFSGFVGMHFGYEWQRSKPSGWHFTPALELEGYYASTTKKANSLINPTDRLPLHQFKDTFPTNMGVMLANGGLIWNNRGLYRVCPYVGVGVGTAVLSIYHARASQVAPPEPGINHFNSDPDASHWVFATQAKAGLRCVLSKYFRLFAEYRFLYLTSSHYTFGSTKYPTHVPTSKWKVDFGGICNNMFAIGVDIPL
jgi:opacity protein-like surface antigen